MFVFSFKATTAKILFAAFLCIAISAAVVSLMPDAGYAMNVNKIVTSADVSFRGIDSAEKRVDLLNKLGIEVDPVPVQQGKVSVPKKFDAVMKKYNDLQKEQGFDLSAYKGKSVERFTYIVTDGEGKMTADGLYATLIIYKNRLIGADVCCPKTGEYAAAVKAE